MGKAAGAITGSIIQDRAIRKGVKRGRQGYRDAIRSINDGKQEGIGYLQPYMNAGQSALNPLSGLLTGITYNQEGERQELSPADRLALFQESPDYQFRLEQGQKSLAATQAARGGLFSGRAGLEAQAFGQDQASTEYGNYLSRLSALAGIGQSSAGQAANVATNTAGQIGQAQIGSGNLAMQGRIARGQIWADTANTIGTNNEQMANRFMSGGAGGGGAF